MNEAMNKKGKTRYDFFAGCYEIVDRFIPAEWRRQATSRVYGRVLEAGIGTGLNLPLYPNCCSEILGIDISTKMLEKAEEKAAHCRVPVKLAVMDIQDMSLECGSFDCVIATFVFCSVPDPCKGLRECFLALKPGGRLILLEHTRSDSKLAGRLMDLLNPLTVLLLGDHINRDTADMVSRAGFKVQNIEYLRGDIFKLIVAKR